MYPEYIQAAATPGALAAELAACVNDPARRKRAAFQASRLRELLSQPRAERPPTGSDGTSAKAGSRSVRRRGKLVLDLAPEAVHALGEQRPALGDFCFSGGAVLLRYLR